MSIFDKAGGVILFACAIPLLLLEEARALASVKDDLVAAREGWTRAEGERDEARRVTAAAVRAANESAHEQERLRVEMSGREVMVSEAKRETREAKRAAVDLQAEVDKARAERDSVAESLALANGTIHRLNGEIRSAESELLRVKRDMLHGSA